MKKNKGARTAEEVMTELEKNPDFVQRRAEKAQRRQQLELHYKALEKPILERLATLGFGGESIDAVVTKYAPLPDGLVNVLLTSLAACEDRRQCDELVRAVAAAKDRFDGRALTDCYDRVTDDEGVRWAVLNTIALTRPHSIDDWLRKARQNPYLHKTLSELGYSW